MNIILLLSLIVKVACVGDSVTEGPAVGNYPEKLQANLGTKHYQVKNYGAGKRTVEKNTDFPYWKQVQFRAAKRFLPDVVIINFGLNDTKPWNWQGKEIFSRDYRAMIRRFRGLRSHPRVFIAIPTPLVLDERFGLTKSVLEQEIAPSILELSSKYHIPLIDLRTPFLARPELLEDFIHPNEEGMQVIADIVFRAVVNLKVVFKRR